MTRYNVTPANERTKRSTIQTMRSKKRLKQSEWEIKLEQEDGATRSYGSACLWDVSPSQQGTDKPQERVHVIRLPHLNIYFVHYNVRYGFKLSLIIYFVFCSLFLADFRRRFLSLLSYQFRAFPPSLALSMLQCKTVKEEKKGNKWTELWLGLTL